MPLLMMAGVNPDRSGERVETREKEKGCEQENTHTFKTYQTALRSPHTTIILTLSAAAESDKTANQRTSLEMDFGT